MAEELEKRLIIEGKVSLALKLVSNDISRLPLHYKNV